MTGVQTCALPILLTSVMVCLITTLFYCISSPKEGRNIAGHSDTGAMLGGDVRGIFYRKTVKMRCFIPTPTLPPPNISEPNFLLLFKKTDIPKTLSIDGFYPEIPSNTPFQGVNSLLSARSNCSMGLYFPFWYSSPSSTNI